MIKKFLVLLVLPLIALSVLCGCGKDRSIGDIHKLYNSITTEHVVNDQNIFFSNELNKQSVNIYYSDSLKATINAENPSNKVQKRYKAISYQQNILDNIFNYYSNHQENFYMIAASKNINKNELNTLYDKVNNLNKTLDEFESKYNTFIDAIESNGIPDIMEYNITSYSYELNKVIDASFEFIYYFHKLNTKYCLQNPNLYTEQTIQVYVDKAYIDMSYIVYLNDIKAFNYSVGENGVCDLAGVVGSDCKYNKLEMLGVKKEISPNILENLVKDANDYDLTMEKLNEFSYCRKIFEQKFNNYLATYSSLNVYTIANYKFDQIIGVTYDNYINSLTASDRAVVVMLDNFVENDFDNYMSKLASIVS